MPQGKQFSHISVNAAEDEDIVIQAGAYRNSAPESQQQVAREGDPIEDLFDEQPAAPEMQDESQACSHAEEPPTGAPVHQAASQDAFEQTLEDLERVPMSSMQKYVLVGLACVVIAFVVYYVIRFVL